jgi:thiamine-phosphate pyrophosphorylase
MVFTPEDLRICLVTDRGLGRGRSLIEIVEAAVRGGATMVQLREKDAPTRVFLEEARALKAMLAPRGVKFIINDRLDIALAVDADGVHVGQNDMPLAEARRLVGPGRIVGLSITNETDMLRADAVAADYLGVGPIYQQQTKADAAPALGVDGFRVLRALTAKPIVAIGGLTPANSAPVLAAGAQGLAIVSAIVAADDPQAATQDFAKLFG